MVDRMADEGLSTLLDKIENGTPPSHNLVPFELVEGESVRNISRT